MIDRERYAEAMYAACPVDSLSTAPEWSDLTPTERGYWCDIADAVLALVEIP